MQEIVIATHNQHKLKEIQAILNWPNTRFLTLSDVGITDDIEEYGLTLSYNARLKAKGYQALCQRPVIAEDSGFFVQALGGLPGVFSKRIYEGHDEAWGNALILDHLSETPDEHRGCYYEAVYVYYDGHQFVEASGKMHGRVAHSSQGDGGFAYDKLFIHDETQRVVSFMDAHEKNNYSHRRQGLLQLNQKLTDQHLV